MTEREQVKYNRIFTFLLKGKRFRNYYCPIAREKGKDLWPIPRVDCMHHRFHNVKWARKKYPLFMDSMLNRIPVNNVWHLQWPSWGKLSERYAARCERSLARHPIMCAFVNGEIESMRGKQ